MVKMREVRMASPRLVMDKRADGSILVYQEEPLGDYPERITDCLVRHASLTPDAIWLAQRGADGEWRKVTYSQGLDRVRSIGSVLLGLGLSQERPLVILSENSIEHALMAIAAQHIGVPSSALSTAYSLVSGDFAKLTDIREQLTPGLLFAQDGARYARAIEAVFDPSTPLVVVRNPVAGRTNLLFEEISNGKATEAVDRAHAAVGPDTIAKFLFTSGTTGSPKAVIQTNRMLCANQAMVRDCFAFLQEEPPVIVDWAPWSHTASGNKVFNMTLYNGGSYYIDEGKPAPGAMDKTIRNLKDIAPTWYFNVPAGFDMLVEAMTSDAQLRENFFRRMRMIMYAGAGLAQHTWDRLEQLAVQTLGERVLLSTGLGATETGPFQLQCVEPQQRPGNIGVPAKGVVLKLVPNDDKLEARVKSDSITPGYWRNPKLTAEAFDEEGFYKLGDAVRFADPDAPERGFLFDGRTAENFKLGTGTWVSVGALRAKLVNEFGGLIADAAIAGENREFLTAIVFANADALREIAGGASGRTIAQLMQEAGVREAFAAALERHQAAATGSASRVMRIMVALEPGSLDRGELTDKGSINQRAVLRHRGELVAKLYEEGADAIQVG